LLDILIFLTPHALIGLKNNTLALFAVNITR